MIVLVVGVECVVAAREIALMLHLRLLTRDRWREVTKGLPLMTEPGVVLVCDARSRSEQADALVVLVAFVAF